MACFEQQIVHGEAVAASIQRQVHGADRIAAEQVQIVGSKPVAERGLGVLVDDDQVTAAVDVLHRCMHDRAPMPVVAREQGCADDDQVVPTLHLEVDDLRLRHVCNAAVFTGEHGKQRWVVMPEVQHGRAQERG